MLLSQRIGKDVKFLFNGPECTTNLFDLRMRIIAATKVIATHEFLNFNDHYANNLIQVLQNSSSTTLKEKAGLYRSFARMPFSSMFIENDTGALLVEQKEESLIITAICKNGFVHPYTAIFHGFHENVSIPIPEIKWYCEDENHFPEEVVRAAKIGTIVHTYLALEVMLFMNVKNVTVHHYVPSKKENNFVPKPLLPKYEYRVLDVFSDIVRYESLTQITDHLTITARSAGKRRSHLVRGHFKEFKNGLFGNVNLAGLYWWNMHRRSKKNSHSVGEIEKGYRLQQA